MQENDSDDNDRHRLIPSWDEGDRSYRSACKVLQVAWFADFEVKSKVFCYLATKYHHDNHETANLDLWERVLNAWEIISSQTNSKSDGVKLVGADQANLQNHYGIMQVTPDAEFGVLEQAHLSLLRKYHPDNKATGSPEQLKAVSLAWQILSNPLSRAEYDQST